MLPLRVLDCVFGPQADNEEGRPEERQRVEKDHGLAIGERQQQSGERRTGEETDALDRARRDVRGRQLGGIGGERRQQRGLSGTERGSEHDRRDRQRV